MKLLVLLFSLSFSFASSDILVGAHEKESKETSLSRDQYPISRETAGLTHYPGVPPASRTLQLCEGDCDAYCAIGEQSQYQHNESTQALTPMFDWNITITKFMSIDEPRPIQGIYNLRSSYVLDNRHYDVELYKSDCETSPTGIDGDTFFPLVFKNATQNIVGTKNEIELEWTYDHSNIMSSDIWTVNATLLYSEFCIKINNYYEINGCPFAVPINFHKMRYRIEVGSLTDMSNNIDIIRLDDLDGGTDEIINYDEQIEVFQCEDDYSEIASPPPLTQGDFVQLCVTTVDGSKFGVDSVKELDISQKDDTPSLYPYVDGFIDSPLAMSDCKADAKNTRDAVCKTKMQLHSGYFDSGDPVDLVANGTVKLDYVGRRLSVDVPMHMRRDDIPHEGVEEDRSLTEEWKEASFAIDIAISVSDDVDYVKCDDDQDKVTITIHTDGKPNETYWFLKQYRASTERFFNVVKSGKEKYSVPHKFYEEKYCVKKNKW